MTITWLNRICFNSSSLHWKTGNVSRWIWILSYRAFAAATSAASAAAIASGLARSTCSRISFSSSCSSSLTPIISPNWVPASFSLSLTPFSRSRIVRIRFRSSEPPLASFAMSLVGSLTGSSRSFSRARSTRSARNGAVGRCTMMCTLMSSTVSRSMLASWTCAIPEPMSWRSSHILLSSFMRRCRADRLWALVLSFFSFSSNPALSPMNLSSVAELSIAMPPSSASYQARASASSSHSLYRCRRILPSPPGGGDGDRRAVPRLESGVRPEVLTRPDPSEPRTEEGVLRGVLGSSHAFGPRFTSRVVKLSFP
mmetsp:Transcript_122559/g.212507  ORF Transcript_122559/g.212507 Transcript_122559/m.212507 type:complete len:312 (-) Transcript_122559:166-1101(-)